MALPLLDRHRTPPLQDYVPAHLKLSELGVEWEGEPMVLTP